MSLQISSAAVTGLPINAVILHGCHDSLLTLRQV